MEPTQSKIALGRFENLKKVTPMSKYLATLLFILLPFIGGWIGYRYAPVRVIEVEIPVLHTKETPDTSFGTIDSLVGKYVAEVGVGEIYISKKDDTHVTVSGQTVLAGPNNSEDEVFLEARTGRLDGTVEMIDGKGVYTDSSDSTCKLNFQFINKILMISQGYETCDVTIGNFDGSYHKEL